MLQNEIPADLKTAVEQKRNEMIEHLANVDDVVGEAFINGEEIAEAELYAAIRRSVIARKFVPVFCGSALKNKGVQLVMDGVVDFLPNPSQVTNYALDESSEKVQKVPMDPARNDEKPCVALAFKLEQARSGQLVYLRIYQGCLRRGDFLYNTRSEKRIRVSRLVRMHAEKTEDVDEVFAGDICSINASDVTTGDTFTSKDSLHLSMESIHVPDPVISMSITPNNRKDTDNFAKGISRFLKEDPTFHMKYDQESKETIVSGMGELHLEIYAQRLGREYNAPCTLGKPKVAFRETLIAPFE